MKFGIFMAESDGCCGVSQLYGFSQEIVNSWSEPRVVGRGKTEEEAYTDLFKTLMEYEPTDHDDGRVFQIWFQKDGDYEGKFDEAYRAEPLRLLIETIPNVITLGEYVNYKSGNKIMGYQWEQQT